MDSIYRGDVVTPAGRRNAWLDSLFVDHAVLRLAWSNFAAVVPGRLYRCNHPTPARLEWIKRRHGIRTVINLRGQCGNGSDALSRQAALRLGLGFIDVAMKSSRAPTRAEVLALVDALRSAAEPALVHCKSGADRAGFAAGVFLILNGGTAAEAGRQLALRFGHLRSSRTGVLDAFFDAWARDGEGRRSFVDWVGETYDPAMLKHVGPTSGIARFVQERLLARE